MPCWLFKSEPSVWGWPQQVARGDAGEEWDGVRNYQARNIMRQMAIGDRGFFYHSQSERAIVGIIAVCAAVHPDSTTIDPRWECVDIRALMPVRRPVTLDAVKADPRLADMALVRQPRLSVQPVPLEAWGIICGMAGIEP
jgi:predicted RNA-binding protein with PUA-like domain